MQRTHLCCALLWILSTALAPTCAQQWSAVFNPSNVTITMGTYKSVHVILSDVPSNVINNRDIVRLVSSNTQVARVDYQEDITFTPRADGSYEAYFDFQGIFIGKNYPIYNRFTFYFVNISILKVQQQLLFISET